MRRYWQPAALSEELPPDGAPLPVRLLGEDLVLFRDEDGRPGLLGLHCAHRGADLSYGRLEDGGLRCIYHGWLYDVNGRCLEQPGEPAGSAFHERIRQLAYPCLERAGVIFAYMGPGEPPLLPNYQFMLLPEEHVFSTKIYNECNYLQGNEGNYDLLHVSFLHYSHRDLRRDVTGANNPGVAGSVDALCTRGSAPHMERIEARLTDFGLSVCKIRRVDDEKNFLRIGTFIFPNLSAFPAGGVNWHVPIDDTHHWKYVISFSVDQPYDKEQLRKDRDRVCPAPDYVPVQNPRNRYLQDRDSMRSMSYSGLNPNYFAAQDVCVTEGAGPIFDRTQEHLVPSDIAVVTTRNLMLKAIKDVQEGRDPPHVIRDPAQNDFSHLVATFGVVPSSLDWKDYCQQLVAERRAWVGRAGAALLA
jgi:hypothetical protein